MISQRQIQKKYAALLKDVATNDYYKIDLTNRVNCYKCVCGHITKTKDIGPGVTPFMHRCEKCGKMANSSFYVDIAPQQKPTEEWYRPSLKEVMKLRSDIFLLDHIFNGGLNVRKIKTNEQ